jgi:SH3-like domain-containing protein
VVSRETVTVVKAHQASVANEANVDEGERVDVIEEAKNYLAVIKQDGTGGWVPRPCIFSSES